MQNSPQSELKLCSLFEFTQVWTYPVCQAWEYTAQISHKRACWEERSWLTASSPGTFGIYSSGYTTVMLFLFFSLLMIADVVEPNHPAVLMCSVCFAAPH